MKWIIGSLIALSLVTASFFHASWICYSFGKEINECYTPAMIDGAMSVIHGEWKERRLYEGVYGKQIVAVWNNGSQRPIVEADEAVAYIKDNSVLFFMFKDNCTVWIVENEPLFMPLYFLEALEEGAKRRMEDKA